jgi:hypothetical protein
MNETQLIRDQLDAERSGAMEVIDAWTAALAHAGAPGTENGTQSAAFRQACIDYLSSVLAWFEQRDTRAGELCARLPADDPRRRALEPVLAREGGSPEVLERLRAIEACYPPGAPGSAACAAVSELAQHMGSAWSKRRETIDGLLAGGGRVADWRMVSGVDADSILEERSRYARVRATAPAGIALSARPVRGGG